MVVLKFPRPITFPDKEMDNYLKCKISFEEAYARLKQSYPGIDGTPLTFHSRSVSKMIKDVRAVIEKNEQALRKEKDWHNETRLSEEDVYHLEQIARAHKTIAVIEFPRPITVTDRPMDAYVNGKASFEKSLRALQKKFPKIETWTRPYKDKPVGEMIAEIKAVIEKNERGAATRPNPEAMKTIEIAIELGNSGAKMLKPPKIPDTDIAVIRQKYNDYVRARDRASALDPRALSYRKKELAFCEENFAKPARQLLEKKQGELEKNAREQAAQKTAQQEAPALKRRVPERPSADTPVSYAGILRSIESTLRMLQGDARIEDIKAYLIQRDLPSDDYVVLNTTGDYVIYIHRKSGGLIAMLKQDEGTYLQGAPLRGEYFAVVEVKEFKRVAGGSIHLPVLADKSGAFKTAVRQ